MGTFRHARLLFTEARQARWLALAAPIATLATYGIFLSLALSPYPEVSSEALPTLEAMCVVLPPVGATLWAYLCVGMVFEEGRDILRVRNRHHVSKAAIRAASPLLLLASACASITAAIVPEYAAEIALQALRVMSWTVLCVMMVAFAASLFSAAFIGLTASLMTIICAYGVHVGWLVYSPSWLRPSGPADSFRHAAIIAVLGLVLASTLFLFEEKQARF